MSGDTVSRPSANGFTLIETLVVVAVVGLILAMGLPKLRTGIVKNNVRGAKALLATMVATARATAVERGCKATLNLTADSAWVTACSVTPPYATQTVGTKKLVGSDFGVVLTPSVASIVYDPRGISTVFQTTTVRVTRSTTVDSVIINPVGKVIRQ